MAVIKVYTNGGQLVDQLEVNDHASGYAVGMRIMGRNEMPLGWLGRALSDAADINAGRDPERPSEKAMRLAFQKESGGEYA